MRLEYGVLCIDDEIDSLGETKQSLSAHNNTVGISTTFIDQPVVKSAREVDSKAFKERIFSEIRQTLNERTFDLILVDLHIGQDFEGGEVVEIIRDQTIYRPIIFYSGGIPAGDVKALEQLNDSIKKHDLAGKSIFVSKRGTDLDAVLRQICTEMHGEEHKLNATRGLLMDRTSDLDAIILKHLQAQDTWGSLSDEQSKKIFSFISRKLKKNGKSLSSKSDELKAIAEGEYNDFSAWIVEKNASEIVRILDSQSRSEILRKLLEVLPNFQAEGEILSRYYNDSEHNKAIANIRNEYAHQTAEQIGSSHNNGRCKFIREELRAHLLNIAAVTSTK